MIQDPISHRVRVLILGGGIHGVGVMHDLASRGWKDVHLIERGRIGCGTSSRSTKLIHGGLRYLKNVFDFPLVYEALHERQVLMSVAPDLVRPLKLYLPVLKDRGMPSFVLRTGLRLYDILAGSARIESYRRETFDKLLDEVPMMSTDKLKDIYSFYDAQTDDLSLVRRVAMSARKLGATLTEGAEAFRIRPHEDGWLVDVMVGQDVIRTISALYVFNMLGPWANQLLEKSFVQPFYQAVNSEGTHLVCPDMGLKAGVFLQDYASSRIFFLLPWMGQTLIGTTEAIFSDNPDRLTIKEEDVRYLLDRVNYYLAKPISANQVSHTFAGLRWLPYDSRRDVGTTSRAHLVSEHKNGRGLLFTLYGGKLTTYRSLAEGLGDKVTKHFGEFKISRTDESGMWLSAEDMMPFNDTATSRFEVGGVAYTPR